MQILRIFAKKRGKYICKNFARMQQRMQMAWKHVFWGMNRENRPNGVICRGAKRSNWCKKIDAGGWQLHAYVAQPPPA